MTVQPSPTALHISARITESVDVKRRLLADRAALAIIEKVADELIQAFRRDRKVLIFGNGGSAADAQHIAAELVGGFTVRERPPLPVEALSVNTSALTAIANDYDFTTVFARQVAAFGRAGDVAIGLSTSGNSANVIAALEVARKNGLVTVGLTGQTGGKLSGLVDYCVRVPSDDTPRIQEVHILLGHILCELVELRLYPSDGGAREWETR